MKLTGECLCGAVAYEIAGTVYDARSCHCSRCRKAFSAQAFSYALVEPEQFSWIHGQELLTTCASEAGFGLQFYENVGSENDDSVRSGMISSALDTLMRAPTAGRSYSCTA